MRLLRDDIKKIIPQWQAELRARQQAGIPLPGIYAPKPVQSAMDRVTPANQAADASGKPVEVIPEKPRSMLEDLKSGRIKPMYIGSYDDNGYIVGTDDPRAQWHNWKLKQNNKDIAEWEAKWGDKWRAREAARLNTPAAAAANNAPAQPKAPAKTIEQLRSERDFNNYMGGTGFHGSL